MTIWQRIKHRFKQFMWRIRPAPIGQKTTKLSNGRTAFVDERGNFKGFK